MLPVHAILFDLDGTLADTAPDLAAAANTMRSVRGLEPLPLASLRPLASHGARGLIGVALGATPADSGYEALRLEFLANYEAALCVQTRLFDGVPALLDILETRAMPWGIVTNKAARFTAPLIELIGLATRSAVTVSGDTTPHTKPHPAPMLHAAAAMGIAPELCLYVGDDLRDIQAGRAAGMQTAAAAYGYCADSDPHTWNADVLIETPLHLLDFIHVIH